jgi:hypothetical protein
MSRPAWTAAPDTCPELVEGGVRRLLQGGTAQIVSPTKKRISRRKGRSSGISTPEGIGSVARWALGGRPHPWPLGRRRAGGYAGPATGDRRSSNPGRRVRNTLGRNTSPVAHVAADGPTHGGGGQPRKRAISAPARSSGARSTTPDERRCRRSGSISLLLWRRPWRSPTSRPRAAAPHRPRTARGASPTMDL